MSLLGFPSVTFTVLPAVDVARGQAVRPFRDHPGAATAASSPRDAARALQDAGAEWIHLVDLDAAFGRGTNAELLAGVVGELDVKVQLSGGIRDDASLEWALATGCERVVVGTAALEDPGWCARVLAEHGERVAVGLDVRIIEDPEGSVRHRLAARGGTRDVGELWATLARLDDEGCARYVVTDVGVDGTLYGPNVALYRAVTQATSARIIGSGGISTIGDLIVLAELAETYANLEGAIVGTALATGRFTLRDALEAVRQIP